MIANTADLAQQLKKNREQALEMLYLQCFPKVARMVKSFGGTQEDAKDVFQDSLVILYEKAVNGQLEIQSSASAYLQGIAKHLWVRQQRRGSHLATFSAMEKRIELSDAFFGEPDKTRLRLFRFLEVAGRKCMEMLQAFYYQRLPLREIAEEFGFANTRSATVQKHKCLEKVRQKAREKSLQYADLVE